MVTPGFSEADYTGQEEDPNTPCRVVIEIPDSDRIDQPLILRLIPRTFAENAAVNGPPIATDRMGINATSKTM